MFNGNGPAPRRILGEGRYRLDTRVMSLTKTQKRLCAELEKIASASVARMSEAISGASPCRRAPYFAALMRAT
jgi:hypothetical protein